MAIIYQDAKMLWDARLAGVSFENTLTVAHQSLKLHPGEVRELRAEYRRHSRDSAVDPLADYTFTDYSDEFLRAFLGVVSLSIMDYSSYEGANIIQDLNTPVPDSLRERFDAVIDCGSLEHVFNFPAALANVMNMVKVGGSLFLTLPSNNFCGHGFYQFSPELMFRVFTRQYGFEIKTLVLIETAYPSVELSPARQTYRVVDPADVRSRVSVVTARPVLMMLHAVKLAQVPLFASSPLQSDYQMRWAEHEKAAHPRVESVLRSLFERLPFPVRAKITGYRERRRLSFKNRRLFTKLS